MVMPYFSRRHAFLALLLLPSLPACSPMQNNALAQASTTTDAVVASGPVAIDVGHSRAQSGARSARGRPEFEFNLALAKVIHQSFAAQGVNSALIGADGNMLDLRKRTETAQTLGASFFLAVHHDSAQPQYLQEWQWQGETRRYTDRFSGFSLFVSRKNPHPERSLQCARQIGLALKQAGLSASPHHAEKIAGEGREWADQAAGVYYFDDLVVLKTAEMPAILLEAGVIVNRDEELVLQQDRRQKLLAKAVLQGMRGCGIAP